MSAGSEMAEGGTVWPRMQSGVRAAVRYVGEALGLLRRHPSLLLFPVLVAAFSAVESGVGDYLSVAHTAYGRWEQRQWARQEKREKEKPSAVPLAVRLDPQWALRTAVQQGAAEVAGLRGAPTWAGEQALMSAVLYGDIEHSGSGSLVLGSVAVAALVLLLLAVNPGLAAGYYGLLGDAVRSGRVEWRAFPARARHYWLRMIALRVLQLTLGWVAVLSGFRSLWLILLWRAWALWVGPLVSVLFALVPVVFVMEEAGLWRAVRESVATVLRRPAVPIVLIAGLMVACFVVVEAQLAVRVTLFPGTLREGVPSAYLTSIPIGIAYEGLLAALGAWAAMTLFVWRAEDREQGGGTAGKLEGEAQGE